MQDLTVKTNPVTRVELRSLSRSHGYARRPDGSGQDRGQIAHRTFRADLVFFVLADRLMAIRRSGGLLRYVEDLVVQLAIPEAFDDQRKVVYRFANRGRRDDLYDARHRQAGIHVLEGVSRHRRDLPRVTFDARSPGTFAPLADDRGNSSGSRRYHPAIRAAAINRRVFADVTANLKAAQQRPASDGP